MTEPAGGAATITCEGRPASLAPLLDFIDSACRAGGVDADSAFALRLAVEEVCTNVIMHGYSGGADDPVTVEVMRYPRSVRVTVEDRAPMFDPADAPAPDLAADWDARAIGGVGWHLVRELMDEVHHEAASPRGTRVTLVKHLPGAAGTQQ